MNDLVPVRWGGILGSDTDYKVFIPGPALKKWGFPPSYRTAFKIGSMILPVTVEEYKTSMIFPELLLFVSPPLAHQCHFPVETKFVLRVDRLHRTLAVGPVIGLFTVNPGSPGFATQLDILKALTESCQKIRAFGYVFFPEDVDGPAGVVYGRLPITDPETGEISWLAASRPLPDVVYDRLPSRSVESRQEIRELKEKFIVSGIPYFNPQFLNKWETHQLLTLDSIAAAFLPETRLFTGPGDIRALLDSFGMVYLKPTAGSLGRRIIRVEKLSPEYIRYKYRTKDKESKEGIAPTCELLEKVLRPVMGKREYIVQQGLQLAEYEGCPFDVRILMQKDNRGNWRRTKIYVRVAAPGNIVSNISDGARGEKIVIVLQEVFQEEFTAANGIGEQLREAARLIPPALENLMGRAWGELALDLGIDTGRRVWLIEVNSKPFRALVSPSGFTKVIERSLMRPLEYAKYLAGYYKHSPCLNQ